MIAWTRWVPVRHECQRARDTPRGPEPSRTPTPGSVLAPACRPIPNAQRKHDFRHLPFGRNVPTSLSSESSTTFHSNDDSRSLSTQLNAVHLTYSPGGVQYSVSRVSKRDSTPNLYRSTIQHGRPKIAASAIVGRSPMPGVSLTKLNGSCLWRRQTLSICQPRDAPSTCLNCPSRRTIQVAPPRVHPSPRSSHTPSSSTSRTRRNK